MFEKMKSLMMSPMPASICRAALVAVSIGVLVVSVGAQCSTGWDVSGSWTLSQEGQELPMNFSLEQNGTLISGTAYGFRRVAAKPVFGVIPTTNGGAKMTGTVRGTLAGDSFNIEVAWANGWVGVYDGKVSPSGRLTGNGYDKRSPNIRPNWYVDGMVKCLPLPATPPSSQRPAPKPIGRTGRKPTPVPDSSKPPSASMKVPGIVASQVYYTFPNAPAGFVILTWDAGPNHPYAEVWYKVNNGQETFLIEKGKGVQQVPVERYKSYIYILTDAGKTLSTVSFAAQ